MSKSWREVYFDKKSCEGVVVNDGNGNITIKGKTKTKTPSTVLYWASSPPNFRSSFSGSGLPYHSPEQAFDRSPNVGAVKSTDGNFQFKVFYPNSYYIGLGSLYVPPQVHIKVCIPGEQSEYQTIKISQGIPYRTLTHPGVQSSNPRNNSLFYDNKNLPIRSQEEILRDSAYPSHGISGEKVVEVSIPNNFWGLRPPV